MKSFIKTLNHPAEAFQEGNKAVSWGLVITTILVNSIFEPVLRNFFSVTKSDIDILNMLKITALGLLSYILISFALWVICKCFGSKVTLAAHINTWGMTYAPTVVCAIAVAFTEVFFFIFWNNTIWGLLFNFVFVGILIWKTILYVIYLRKFTGLKGWRFLGACGVMGGIILIMAALNGYVGLKTPVL